MSPTVLSTQKFFENFKNSVIHIKDKVAITYSDKKQEWVKDDKGNWISYM